MLPYRNAIVAVFAATAAISATPVIAQTKAPFTGPYIDVVGGWDRTQTNSGHDDGFLYGGQAGYDLSAGKVRFGPEIEVTGSTQKDCNVNAGVTDCLKSDRDLFAGARVGYVVTPKALVYVTGGYTNARYAGLAASNSSARVGAADLDGARVGAGIEYAVTEHVFVKTEYRYSTYSDSIDRNQVIGAVGFRF